VLNLHRALQSDRIWFSFKVYPTFDLASLVSEDEPASKASDSV